MSRGQLLNEINLLRRQVDLLTDENKGLEDKLKLQMAASNQARLNSLSHKACTDQANTALAEALKVVEDLKGRKAADNNMDEHGSENNSNPLTPPPSKKRRIEDK